MSKPGYSRSTHDLNLAFALSANEDMTARTAWYAAATVVTQSRTQHPRRGPPQEPDRGPTKSSPRTSANCGSKATDCPGSSQPPRRTPSTSFRSRCPIGPWSSFITVRLCRPVMPPFPPHGPRSYLATCVMGGTWGRGPNGRPTRTIPAPSPAPLVDRGIIR